MCAVVQNESKKLFFIIFILKSDFFSSFYLLRDILDVAVYWQNRRVWISRETHFTWNSHAAILPIFTIEKISTFYTYDGIWIR